MIIGLDFGVFINAELLTIPHKSNYSQNNSFNVEMKLNILREIYYLSVGGLQAYIGYSIFVKLLNTIHDAFFYFFINICFSFILMGFFKKSLIDKKNLRKQRLIFQTSLFSDTFDFRIIETEIFLINLLKTI